MKRSSNAEPNPSSNPDCIKLRYCNEPYLHNGNLRKAESSSLSEIVVNGEVSELSIAKDHGIIYSFGNTERVKAEFSGKNVVCGNPAEVIARDNGSVIIFGETSNATSLYRGHITIVSLIEGFEPEKYKIRDHGSIRIITPGQNRHITGSNYLLYNLNRLFRNVSKELVSDERNQAYMSVINSASSRYLKEN